MVVFQRCGFGYTRRVEKTIEVRYAGVVIGRAAPMVDGQESAAAGAAAPLAGQSLLLGMSDPMPVGTTVSLHLGDLVAEGRVDQIAESSDPTRSAMRVRLADPSAQSLFADGAQAMPAPREPAPAPRPVPSSVTSVVAAPASGPVTAAPEPLIAAPAPAPPAGVEPSPAVAAAVAPAPTAVDDPARRSNEGSPDSGAAESEGSIPSEVASTEESGAQGAGGGSGGGGGRRRRRRR